MLLYHIWLIMVGHSNFLLLKDGWIIAGELERLNFFHQVLSHFDGTLEGILSDVLLVLLQSAILAFSAIRLNLSLIALRERHSLQYRRALGCCFVLLSTVLHLCLNISAFLLLKDSRD